MKTKLIIFGLIVIAAILVYVFWQKAPVTEAPENTSAIDQEIETLNIADVESDADLKAIDSELQNL